MASESDIPAPVREAMATMTSEEVARIVRREAAQHYDLCVNPLHHDSTAAALLLAAQAVEREQFWREQAINAHADLLSEISGEGKDGWLCSNARSSAVHSGEWLVQYAGWERRPDGRGRVQWYRPQQPKGGQHK